MSNSAVNNYGAQVLGRENTVQKKGFAALMMSLFKIGLVGFGGGSALIPVIEQEVVTDRGLVTEEEYNKDTLAACITPGALPVEISTGLGLKAFGVSGMLTAALAMAIPGSFLTVAILAALSGANSGVLSLIQCLSIGLGAFISSLLVVYGVKTMKEAKKESSNEALRTLAVILGVFLLSCGKSLSSIPFMNGHYLFGLSTIQILGASFFVIFYTGGQLTRVNTLVSASFVLAYILAKGKIALIDKPVLVNGIVAAMVLLSVYGLVKGMRGDIQKNGKLDTTIFKKNSRSLRNELLAWIAFVVVCSIPALVITGETPAYLFKGFISTLMSFGGGDAYLSVADGMFVDSGVLTKTEFYSFLVPVANVLPGSILCKILTGVGYYLGFNVGGSVFAGLWTALAGLAVSTAASGAVFCVVYHAYECLETTSIFQTIGKWIKPIISGLLLSVMVSMVSQNLSTASEIGANVGSVLLVTLGILALDLYLYLVKKVSNMTLIVISASVGLVLVRLVCL